MNRIIKFHLKIKACDHAWRWMLENENMSPRELWRDCPYGEWLVDYVGLKLRIDPQYILNATCDYIRNVSTDIFNEKQRRNIHFIAEQAQTYGRLNGRHLQILATRSPNLSIALQVLSGLADIENVKIPYESTKCKTSYLHQFADCIRNNVPYDLVVAKREKLGG